MAASAEAGESSSSNVLHTTQVTDAGVMAWAGGGGGTGVGVGASPDRVQASSQASPADASSSRASPLQAPSSPPSPPPLPWFHPRRSTAPEAPATAATAATATISRRSHDSVGQRPATATPPARPSTGPLRSADRQQQQALRVEGLGGVWSSGGGAPGWDPARSSPLSRASYSEELVSPKPEGGRFFAFSGFQILRFWGGVGFGGLYFLGMGPRARVTSPLSKASGKVEQESSKPQDPKSQQRGL